MKLVYSILFCALFSFSTQSLKAFALYCPSDVWLNCNDDIWDLSGYGNAYYVLYGSNHDAGSPSVVYDVNSCNVGVIYRTWTAWNPYSHKYVSCTQNIYVNSSSYFNSSNIYWPHQELQLYGCNTSIHPNDLPYGYGKPHYDYLTCNPRWSKL